MTAPTRFVINIFQGDTSFYVQEDNNISDQSNIVTFTVSKPIMNAVFLDLEPIESLINNAILIAPKHTRLQYDYQINQKFNRFPLDNMAQSNGDFLYEPDCLDDRLTRPFRLEYIRVNDNSERIIFLKKSHRQLRNISEDYKNLELSDCT